MKILLVKPYNLSDHIQPSLGLGYLASSLRNGYDVEILDCIKNKIKGNLFSGYLESSQPDVVGIQCYTFDLYGIKNMLRECKKRSIITVIGGPHPSAVPEETMEFFGDDLDYLFQGEAEAGLKSLMDKLDNKVDIDFAQIPGLAWRENNKVLVNDKCFIEDIDTLGMPAWDLIKPEEYPEAQHGAFFKKFPIAPVMATRGCPFSCTFCAGHLVSGKRLRKRSVESLLNEIKTLYHDRGIREFHIVDDNFTLDRIFAKNLLAAIKKSNLDISWAVPNGIRMDTLDDEILELMKETGLYLISLGIESGSDRVLNRMMKNTTTEKIKRAVSMIRRHKIDIAGFFILGFPGETIDDIKRTISFSRELDLVRANFFTYLPFPGTASFNELKAQSELNDVDLKKFYFMNATYTPEDIDKKTLKNFQREAFLRFFLRPGILLYNLSRIKSFRHFKFLLGRFFRWMVLK